LHPLGFHAIAPSAGGIVPRQERPAMVLIAVLAFVLLKSSGWTRY
jgi:hypothetical protein